MAIISIKDLSFMYPTRNKKVLNNINLNIETGQFVIICGKSGCGKTTLLRHLKPTLTPYGKIDGNIYYKNKEINELNIKEESKNIGYVHQSPDNQIVTDKVWHELAFGLESLGYKTPEIRARVAEMASFFGIQTWFYKKVSELSGGQKQLLNLASIMVMQPEVLILDEPTSQLDPIAATDFLETLSKINRELGTTIILTEHRLEEAFALVDRAVVIENGNIIADGNPKQVGEKLKNTNNDMFAALPTPMKVYAKVDNNLECPVTVKEGREWLERLSEIKNINTNNISENSNLIIDNPIIETDEVWFKYEREGNDIVKGLSVKINKGEIFSILGGNGTGKTTTLSLLSGINKPYRGIIKINGKNVEKISDKVKFNGLMGVMPQNPQSLFVKKTVGLDLLEMFSGRKITKEDRNSKIDEVIKLCELEELIDSHPYDLSGGEQQRAALAKVLLLSPKILLLDEPTKGLDGHFKVKLSNILDMLRKSGITIIMVSHDIEFCAENSSRCAMFFDGNIVSIDNPREFFCGKSFYTTAANRMARTVISRAVLYKDIVECCNETKYNNNLNIINKDNKKDIYKKSVSIDNNVIKDINSENIDKLNIKKVTVNSNLIDDTKKCIMENEKNYTHVTDNKQDKICRNTCSIDKKTISCNGSTGNIISDKENKHIKRDTCKFKDISKRIFIGTLFIVLLIYTYFKLYSPSTGWKHYFSMFVMIVEMFVIFSCIFKQQSLTSKSYIVQVEESKRKLTKRTLVSCFIVLLLIPLTLFIGIFYLENKKYYFISLLVVIESMIPFFVSFEDKKLQPRELIVIAVLCAIGVTSRIAFFFLPQFKPVLAVIIIAGVCFGGETGFLVGSITAIVSNMYFTQGPLTPWQMFAFGIVGLFAGIFFKKGLLMTKKTSLCIYGMISSVFLCGVILDFASAVTWQTELNYKIIFSYFITGIPFNLILSIATAFFLWFMAEPMIEKLDRIKLKYGILD